MDQIKIAPKIIVNMSNILTIADFPKICRICLQTQNNKISISSFDIMNMIMTCASVQISETDSLPHQICVACFNNLKCAYTLKKLCIKSDQILRQLVELQEEKFNTIQTLLNENVQNSVAMYENSNCYLENTKQKLQVNVISDSNEVNEDITDQNLDEFIKNEELEVNTTNEFVEDELNNGNYISENTCNRVVSNNSRLPLPKFNINRYKFKCDDCPCRFETVWQLGKHMRRHHFVQGLNCDKCSKVFYHPLHLEEHNKKHTERVTCDHCSKTYRNVKALETHKLVVHSGQLPFSCSECNNEKFESKFKLEKHLFFTHKKGKDPCQFTTCHICEKTVQKSAYRKHCLTHVSDRPKITCQLCTKSFSSKYSLEEHINGVHKKIHTLKYSCPICGKKLPRPSSVKYHMVTHTKEKAYSCEKCLTLFTTKSALTTHISRTHLNLRKFSCPICQLKFFDRSSVENHIRTHTGKRPFKCTICEKTFSFKSALISHNKNIHLKKTNVN